MAELLYEQHEKQEVNPAQIMNHLQMKRNTGKWQLCSIRRIKEVTTAEEQEKALQETILRVKDNSIEDATANLDPTDIQGCSA